MIGKNRLLRFYDDPRENKIYHRGFLNGGCPKRACKKYVHHKTCHAKPRRGISCQYQRLDPSVGGKCV